MIEGVLALTLCACSGASLVLKSPIEDRCNETGLKGCEQIADGMISYVEGDKLEALKKAGEAGALNSPEEVEKFALAVNSLSSLPGAEPYIGPLNEVVEVILSRAKESHATWAPPKTQGKAKAKATISADIEEEDAPEESAKPRGKASVASAPEPVFVMEPAPDQISGGTTMPASDGMKLPCSFGFGVGFCVQVAAGPLLITDLMAGACSNDLLVAAAPAGKRPESPRWLAPVPTSGAHGARLAIGPDEALFIGVQASSASKLSADPRCAVTWSAQTPSARRVPGKL